MLSEFGHAGLFIDPATLGPLRFPGQYPIFYPPYPVVNPQMTQRVELVGCSPTVWLVGGLTPPQPGNDASIYQAAKLFLRSAAAVFGIEGGSCCLSLAIRVLRNPRAAKSIMIHSKYIIYTWVHCCSSCTSKIVISSLTLSYTINQEKWERQANSWWEILLQNHHWNTGPLALEIYEDLLAKYCILLNQEELRFLVTSPKPRNLPQPGNR